VALVGLLAFCFVLALPPWRRRRRQACAAALFLFFLAAGFGVFLATDSGVLWLTKLERDATSLPAGEIDTVATGRVLLWTCLVEDLVRNPITGAGFYGVAATAGCALFDREDGLSPHQQYLGAVWKMGLPVGLSYFVWLAMLAWPAWRHRHAGPLDRGLWALVLAYATAWCLVWDSLTLTMLGGPVLLLLGGGVNANRG
jgi:hypothetical protein